MRESGPAVPPDFLGTARAVPVPCPWPGRAVPVPCAWPLCGSHTQAVWQPYRLCGSHTGAVAVPQQHIVAVEKPQQPVGCLNRLHNEARIRPENIESGTNGVGKPPFGLKLCVVRAVPLRMPPKLQKKQKNVKKTWVLAIFGAGAHRALFPPYFPVWCGALRGGAKRLFG